MERPENFIPALEAHKKLLYKVASLYCANPADRQDLLQEIVTRLWRSWASFEGRSDLATWMYRVALNTAITWVREDRREGRHVVREEALVEVTLAEEPAPTASPHLRIFLGQVLASLDELDRALVLLYLEGHGHEAIAAILGLSTTNVATKINRIKTRLQKEYGE